MPEKYPYLYAWRDQRPCRRGQFLKITNKGIDYCGVEFEDGSRLIVSRLAFKLRPGAARQNKVEVFGEVIHA